MQFQEIEKSRHSIEQQKNADRMALENKLKVAANSRDENMKKMLDRLKDHVSWAQLICSRTTEKLK